MALDQPPVRYGLTGPAAIFVPEIEDGVDFSLLEEILEKFGGRDEYIIPSGWGMQGHVGLNLYMRNPHSKINVVVPSDRTMINAWWYAAPDVKRLNFIATKTNSAQAIASAILTPASELVAVCEFAEYLTESEQMPNGQPWKVAVAARRMGLPVATKILRPVEESQGITRDSFLKWVDKEPESA